MKKSTATSHVPGDSTICGPQIGAYLRGVMGRVITSDDVRRWIVDGYAASNHRRIRLPAKRVDGLYVTTEQKASAWWAEVVRERRATRAATEQTDLAGPT